MPGGSFAKASLVGAKTVNGPGPASVSTRPAAFTAATSVVWSFELTALSTMVFDGYIGAPPTITVASICADAGDAMTTGRASAPSSRSADPICRMMASLSGVAITVTELAAVRMQRRHPATALSRNAGEHRTRQDGAALLAMRDTLWFDQPGANWECPARGWTRLAINDDRTGLPTEPITSLLARCTVGDAAAFRTLYDLQSSRLYGIALRVTRQPSLAADAVHDALLQVWRSASRFDAARGVPEVWLASLVRYRAIDLMRRQTREMTGQEMEETADEAAGPLDRLLAERDGAALHRCLMRLEATQQRAITLAFIEGLSHSELAARLAAPLGTVKSWIRRGLLALKECLAS